MRAPHPFTPWTCSRSTNALVVAVIDMQSKAFFSFNKLIEQTNVSLSALYSRLTHSRRILVFQRYTSESWRSVSSLSVFNRDIRWTKKKQEPDFCSGVQLEVFLETF